ncbi:Endoribonuclease L-PSP/chorismate mutase-like protein [Aspergillus bertholletiae]|uniref:Endoribonuclease L-PSP/chorismate mutase-like protein n=1 Tax=Aspergillus bertholletiae TaxID=1226010 RepID=A0A5N7BJ36_9EURO|nr:Endoribonuclease L-PSP/chorismate mutase-like protein [Aspergillus bertholletiae]
MSSNKTAIVSHNAPAPSLLMSQALICQGMIYCSGSLGIDPKTGKFVDGDASDRTVQALRNLEEILKSGGSDLGKVVKVTIFLSSMDHYAKVNEGYGKVFTHDVKPCRTCVAVAKLPLDAEVEIELIASVR